jgi:hypothetical protein
MNALRKKTSKSSVAILAGSGEAFATSYWAQATDTLDTLRRPVVRANAATAVTEGQGALEGVQLLAGPGDIPAARQAAEEEARRLSGVMKRLRPLAASLSRPEAKETMEPLEMIVHSLEAERKRLKKLAKRS